MTIERRNDDRFGDDFDDELVAAVNNALHEVCARHGAMVESFAGMVNFMTDDAQPMWTMFRPGDQMHHTTLGIVDFMAAYEHEVRRINIQYHIEHDGDDD